MKRKLTIIFIFIFSLFMFAACAKKNDWNYTKEDLVGSINIEGTINLANESNTITFDSKDLYKKSPRKKDVYVIDLQKALTELQNNGEYLTYDIVKACNVNISSIKNENNITTISFDGNEKEYAVIINKNVIKNSKYTFVTAKVPSLGEINTDLLSFEDNYLTSEFEWDVDFKLAIQIISQIGMIVAGFKYDNPITVAGGFINIVASIATSATSSSLSVADVLSKLDEMDKKLDDISKKIDDNYNLLMTESIKTQAKVDTVLLNQMKEAITSYVTTLQLPIDNYNNDFGDHIDQSYKTLVKTTDSIEVPFRRIGSYWEYAFNYDNTANEKIIIENIEYSNALRFLSKNNNIVRKGFVDELEKDLLYACSKMDVPSYITASDLVKMTLAKLVENFTQDYYVQNHQKALEIRNLLTNLTKRIAGIGGFESIVDTYISRLEYMYNFASETKEPLANILSNMLYNLDNNVALALEACIYAEVNSDELEESYKLAREKIQNKYNEIKNRADGYSFITENVWKGDYYNANYEVGYTNLGNHPSFKANFTIYRLQDGQIAREDIKTKKIIADTDMQKIKFRMGLLQQLGLDDSETFIEYLNKCNVVSNNAVNEYKRTVANEEATEHDYKILSDISVRGLNNGDTGMDMVCAAKGNNHSVCYDIGKKYKYRGKNADANWGGQMLSAVFIDGKNGQKMKEENVCAYATFYESHWYWLDDEIFAFINDPVGSYFFILENI